MNFPKHTKYLFISLLVLVNFVMRIPSVPHETGNDGFTIHILANSVSLFGYAGWWAHPSSVFGFYPYSYASAVPFILSGISQCTGIDMEVAIWMFCIIIGLFSVFTAYLLAGVIWNNDIFKFLIAFVYSLSPGILTFSTWDVSTRGLFIVLLPLFIYLLLKIRESIMKFGVLFLILFILLMATHHYVFLTIPAIFSFIILAIFNKSKGCIKSVKISLNFTNIAFIIAFIAMFLMPFFTRIFGVSSRYLWIQLMLENNIRYTGIIVIFAIGGFAYLSLKHDKSFGEWFFLLSLLCLTPLLYILTYMHYFIIIFGSVLIGISLSNITNIVKVDKQKKKYALAIIMIILLISVSFSGFYQHWRTHKGKATAGEWYMDEETYSGALWIRENVNMNKRLVGNDDLTCRRIFAVSEVPTLVGMGSDCMLTYGFTKITDINITKNSPLTIRFYQDNPYVKDPHSIDIGSSFYWLQNSAIDSEVGSAIVSRFNLSYAIENKNAYSGAFIQSLHEKRNNIFNNGKIKIWYLY